MKWLVYVKLILEVIIEKGFKRENYRGKRKRESKSNHGDARREHDRAAASGSGRYQ